MKKQHVEVVWHCRRNEMLVCCMYFVLNLISYDLSLVYEENSALTALDGSCGFVEKCVFFVAVTHSSADLPILVIQMKLTFHVDISLSLLSFSDK